MPSRKQGILCDFLYHGIIMCRMACSAAAYARWWQFLRKRSLFFMGYEEANFLHRIHLSILDPEFTENDISFINWAFPTHIKRLGGDLSPTSARLMIEFYDLVPPEQRSQLEWHPSQALRELASREMIHRGMI